MFLRAGGAHHFRGWDAPPRCPIICSAYVLAACGRSISRIIGGVPAATPAQPIRGAATSTGQIQWRKNSGASAARGGVYFLRYFFQIAHAIEIPAAKSTAPDIHAPISKAQMCQLSTIAFGYSHITSYLAVPFRAGYPHMALFVQLTLLHAMLISSRRPVFPAPLLLSFQPQLPFLAMF